MLRLKLIYVSKRGHWGLHQGRLADLALRIGHGQVITSHKKYEHNYINPGYGLSLVDTLWNASSYRQPLEQEGNPMT